MKKILLLVGILSAFLYAEVRVYGPGGPASALKELALEYEQKTGQKVTIVAGPPSTWMQEAKTQADIIVSGSSIMMDNFIQQMEGKLDPKNIRVLNIREAGILVRPGNPKKIKGFQDLLDKKLKIIVVNGAGQVGLYEDMALKNGKIENLIALRKNIAFTAPNTKVALEKWNSDSSMDVLITWRHWANMLGKDKAEFIASGKDNVVYRASEAVIVNKSPNAKGAKKFLDFILSKEAQKIWEAKGWIANP
ncbi:MAG: extracellular solute-binding protein [Helicobacter sp.]|nr:extracellular solute-binding protein [Helicobacter sp.]